MRDIFPAYYPQSGDSIRSLWKNCVFVFDTNTLLRLYEYNQEAKSSFIHILEQIQDRVWIPHQVGLEYHRRRSQVIQRQSKSYTQLLTFLSELPGKIETTFKVHPILNIKEIADQIREQLKSVEEAITTASKQHPQRDKIDEVLDALSNIFTRQRIGLPYTGEVLLQKEILADHRLASEIPPGFGKDEEKKNGNQYGDVMVWLQLLDYAQDTQKPILLITNDRKPDWWNDRQPHLSLIQEIKDVAGVDFWMYTSDDFLRNAERFLGIKVKSDVIEEVREVREEEERRVVRASDLIKKWGGLNSKEKQSHEAQVAANFFVRYIQQGDIEAARSFVNGISQTGLGLTVIDYIPSEYRMTYYNLSVGAYPYVDDALGLYGNSVPTTADIDPKFYTNAPFGNKDTIGTAHEELQRLNSVLWSSDKQSITQPPISDDDAETHQEDIEE